MVAQRHVELVREAIDDLRERGDEEHATAVESVLKVALSPNQDDSIPDGYLTTGEAATQFGLGAKLLREWVAKGRLPGLKQGRRLLVPRAEVRALLGLPKEGESLGPAPWERLTPAQSAALAQVAHDAVPRDKLARLEELNEKMEYGEPMTRAERSEMLRLAKEVNAAATKRLEELVKSGWRP